MPGRLSAVVRSMGVKWEWEWEERGKWEDFLVMGTVAVVESPRFVELGSELPQIRM